MQFLFIVVNRQKLHGSYCAEKLEKNITNKSCEGIESSNSLLTGKAMIVISLEPKRILDIAIEV
ncbi:hypothetical protein YC2023_022805 [Brassica napus]